MLIFFMMSILILIVIQFYYRNIINLMSLYLRVCVLTCMDGGVSGGVKIS